MKSTWHASLVARLATALGNRMAEAISTLGSLFHHDFPSQLVTPRLSLFATLVIILVAQYIRSPWRKVPPGPKGLPILGNALQLRDKDWMYRTECKRKFGSSSSSLLLLTLGPFALSIEISEHIMYMNALGQPVIVLHSLKATFELLDRRANTYSDHPHFIVAHDILSGGLFAAFMSYGDAFVWPLLLKFQNLSFLA